MLVSGLAIVGADDGGRFLPAEARPPRRLSCVTDRAVRGHVAD
jgi:hypothetical protein